MQNVPLGYSWHLHSVWTPHPSRLYCVYPFEVYYTNNLDSNSNWDGTKRSATHHPIAYKGNKIEGGTNSYEICCVCNSTRFDICCMIRSMNRCSSANLQITVGANKRCPPRSWCYVCIQFACTELHHTCAIWCTTNVTPVSGWLFYLFSEDGWNFGLVLGDTNSFWMVYLFVFSYPTFRAISTQILMAEYSNAPDADRRT